MYERWGEPEWEAAPLGVSLGVLLSEETAYGNADDTWNRVVNSMSGIFCASLNLLTHEKTHRLHEPFAPKMSPKHLFMSGTLPKETVCTENLTPFLRLLPCDNRAGLTGLLNPTRVFDAEYSLLDLTAQIVCTDSKCALQLQQNVRLVFNRLKWTGSCDWSVEQVFGRQFTKTCAGTEPKITVGKGKLGKFVGITDNIDGHIDGHNLTVTVNNSSTIQCQ